MNNNPVGVIVAETSVIIRTGLVTVLKHLGLNLHISEVSDMAHLNGAVTRQAPDLLIINPAFPGVLYQTQFQTATQSKHIRSVALLTAPTDPASLAAYNATITLYETPEQIHKKLANLIEGEKEEESEPDSLSSREREIVVCVVKGMTNKQIAEQLSLSTHTVITHRRNISNKLHIHSAAGLTVYAIVNKLVELSEIREGLLSGDRPDRD